jgi:xylulokinase
MGTILTLDLGTTLFKVCAFNDQGNLCARQRIAPPIRRDSAGRCELTVPDFLAAAGEGLRALTSALPEGGNDVNALSFATQTNSFVLLDEAMQPLTPLVLWPDRRAEGDTDLVRLFARINALRDATGIPAITAPFMVAKLRWFQKHRPDVWTRVRRISLLSDYLTWWFTGQHVTEAGALGLTGLCDVRTLKWVPAMRAAAGLRLVGLPQIVRAGTDLGTILPSRAKAFGLPASCRFVVGCLDQYAGAIGVGNVRAGGCSETTGTVLAVVRCARRAVPVRGQIFQGPGWDAGWFYRMSFGERSANLLEWYRNQQADRPSFETLDAEAAAVPPGANGLRLTDRAGRGAIDAGFAGPTARHKRGHYVRCILESVAQALGGHVAALYGKRLPAEIRCAGGGARSDLWLQIKADMLGTTLVATECPEPTSLGAAMLAGRALGWGHLPRLAARWVRHRAVFAPRAAVRRAYAVLPRAGP